MPRVEYHRGFVKGLIRAYSVKTRFRIRDKKAISFILKEARRKALHIDIAPETERVVREELRSGHFRSVDDLILSGVEAWRERNTVAPATEAPQKTLLEFFRTSPLVGLELDFERDADAGRDIEL